jgi:hypothetical protein
MIPKERRQDCFAVAILLAMLVWFCDEIIFAGKIPFFRDLAAYFYPIKFSVADALKAGELPLWDRHMATGFPVMAGFQSAVFYPPSLFFYFLPFLAAIQLSYVFHFAVALFGGYVLFRSWKYPVHISVISGILFAFGGTMVSLNNLLNHFQSAVWLPWVLLFWERTILSRRWLNFVGLTILLACQLLAGSPEIFLLAMGLLVLDAIRLFNEQQLREPWQAGAILICAGLAVVGLTMVQLLPTGELIAQSRRDQAIPAVEALAWSLRPSSLLGLLLPTLEADSSFSFGVRLLLVQGVPFLLSHYIGVISLFGLAAWFRAARLKERVTSIGLVAISLILAFGSNTPIYPYLYEWVPLFRVMRFPEKYFYLTYVLLIFVVVRGLANVANNKESRPPWLAGIVIFIAWVVTYGICRWDSTLLVKLFQPNHANVSIAAANPMTVAAILFSIEKQIAVSAILALLFFLIRFGLLRQGLLNALLVLVVFVDLSVANKPLQFLRDKEIIANAPRLLDKPPADYGRLFYYPPGNNLHPSFVTVNGNPSYEKATEISLNNLLPNAGIMYGFEYFQDIDALGRQSYTDFLTFINSLPVDRRGNLLRALNIRYVVAFYPLDVKGLKLLGTFPEHYSRLYEVTGGVPRTYVVGRAIYDLDPQSTLRRLSTDEFNPLQEVIVDTPTHLASKGNFQGSAAIKRYHNNQVQIDAQLSVPGILVLADAFYPGWKVRVDGKEQKILRANYLFRSVELPAGNHKVEFIYDPQSFKVGLIFSLGTVGLLLAVSLLGWFRRRAHVANVSGDISERPVTLLPQ